MTSGDNYYQILAVAPDASPEEIKKAYKRLARVYHPDLNPKRQRSAEDRFKRLQAAYSVLSDPDLRREYDQSRGVNQPLRASEFVTEYWEPPIVRRYDLRGIWESPFVRNLSARRKVALCVWLICLIGTFLPTSSLVFSWNDVYDMPLGARMLWATVPLLLIWCGTSMSDTSTYDVSPGTVIKEGFGRVIEFAAWVYFARLIGLTVIGPLIVLMS